MPIPNAPILLYPVSGASRVLLPLTFTWERSTGATTYKIQVAKDADFQNLVIDQSVGNVISWLSTGLRNRQKYYWRVRASNPSGDSNYSTVSNFRVVEREAVKVIADILKAEMGLSDDQIILTNQKFNIPKNQNIYIAISYVSGQSIGNVSSFIPTENGLDELLQTTMFYQIQIDALSFGDEARIRKEEIILSLKSVFSQNKQEENNLQIANIPSQFLDVSMLEQTARLNRYTMSIAVTSLINLQKSVDYYSTFSTPEVLIND